MKNQTSDEVKEVVLEEELVSTGNQSQLIVYNDEVNTFEWVIQCFMEILNHSYEQAEQLSLIIHFTGKASVKKATFEELKPKKEALIDRGLSAVIESLV